jgi:hypothetical protein
MASDVIRIVIDVDRLEIGVDVDRLRAGFTPAVARLTETAKRQMWLGRRPPLTTATPD